MNTKGLLILSAFFSLLLFFSSCVTTPKEDQVIDNTVHIRLQADPGGLNHYLPSSGYTPEVTTLLFSPLMTFDPENLQLTPLIIKGRPMVSTIQEGPWAGGESYTFEILDEAKWDNGSPILASDYVFTLKTLFNPKVPTAPYRGYFNLLRDIQIDPDNPRKFTVMSQEPYIISEAVFGNVDVLPEYVYDPEGLMKDIPLRDLLDPQKAKELAEENPNIEAFASLFQDPKYAFDINFISGSGPYKVVEIIENQRITLERKTNWWGDEMAKKNKLLAAYPDKIIFRSIPDETAAISLLKDQKIDAMNTLPPLEFKKMQDNPTIANHYELATPMTMSIVVMFLNNKSPKLSNEKVRRAIAHLLDVDMMMEKVVYGYGQRVTGPVHPNKDYVHKGLQPIAYDLEKARSILAAEGWTDTNGNGVIDKMIDGELVEMNLNYLIPNGNSSYENIATLIKEHVLKAGINVEIEVKDFKTLLTEYRGQNFEIVTLARRSLPVLADFTQSWHTSSDHPKGHNSVGFGDAESDAIIDSIRTTLDKKKRDQLYLKFQEIIYEDQPVVFLWAPTQRIVINKRFEAKTSTLRPGYFPRYFKVKNGDLVDR